MILRLNNHYMCDSRMTAHTVCTMCNTYECQAQSDRTNYFS